MSAAISFLYSSLNEEIPSTVGNTGCFDFVGIIPRLLTSS